MTHPGGSSLALLLDLYELTMAEAHWARGSREEACFQLAFRHNPFGGGYVVAAGLEPALQWLEALRFTDDDLAYLAELPSADGRKGLFSRGFLAWLGRLRFTCDVDAVPEGTVVFPYEPLLRVAGPIVEAQIVETALLTFLNFQSLVATKAARVVGAARGGTVLEFGLRRAQGVDGGLSASRAAWLGGVHATSNVLAGRLYGIPVRGTQAHSWIMAFDDEPSSFEAWARAMPHDALFLVDTYDSLEGVRRACAVGRHLRAAGHRLLGVRLDSGDLAWLSREARRILDAEGFPDATIVASSDLDEQTIESLVHQGARVDTWGVGTRLVTGWGEPALGGVYKLAAVRSPGAPWSLRLKLSEQVEKTTIPGLLQVRRLVVGGEYAGDVIHLEGHPPAPETAMIDPVDPTRRKTVPAGADLEDLLVPVLRAGRRVAPAPPLVESRARAGAQLARFHDGIKRLLNPHRYPVGLSHDLHELRTAMILAARGASR